jgi:hypothetical protein
LRRGQTVECQHTVRAVAIVEMQREGLHWAEPNERRDDPVASGRGR